MLKKEIRSLIFNLLPKYDKTGKYHPLVLDEAIRKVLGEMYNEIYAVNPNGLLKYTKAFGYTVPLAVSSEATTGLYYTLLPCQIITFDDKSSGVRRVSTPVQGGMSFFPMYPSEMDYALSGSNVHTVTSKIGYCVSRTRLEFYKMTGVVLSSGIRADIIVPFTEYVDTDDVMLPEHKNEKGEDFIQRVLAILGVIQPVDLKDDNAEKQVANG